LSLAYVARRVDVEHGDAQSAPPRRLEAAEEVVRYTAIDRD
jgi:hypothetical protein